MPILWLELFGKLTVSSGGEPAANSWQSHFVRMAHLRLRLNSKWRLSAAKPFMSTEESEIYEFLKRCPHRHVPVEEILQRARPGKEFSQDRNWTQAILRRMEIEGWVEANAQGDYRLKSRPDETTAFKKALETPGAQLGDTTIISLQDVTGEQAEAV